MHVAGLSFPWNWPWQLLWPANVRFKSNICRCGLQVQGVQMPHVLVLGLQSQQLLTLEMQEFEAQDVLLGHLAGLDAIICSGRIHDEEVMKRVVQCLLLVAGRDARLKQQAVNTLLAWTGSPWDLWPAAASRLMPHGPIRAGT